MQIRAIGFAGTDCKSALSGAIRGAISGAMLGEGVGAIPGAIAGALEGGALVGLEGAISASTYCAAGLLVKKWFE